MKIAIVAGEQSGDELGAALMQALLERHSKIHFFGVGGDKMQALGLRSLFPQERLAVMGFVEPLKRLPDLIKAKNTVIKNCEELQPDLFLGIDSPDFNLRIEKVLRDQGIKTAHYVSPSVWAWRQGRIKGIRESVDLMLTLFPFEVDFYNQHQVPAICVGHPLADTLALEGADDQALADIKAKLNLSIERQKKVITLMPGSRGGEVSMMGDLFLSVARRCLEKRDNLEFILPAANRERYVQLQAMHANCTPQLQQKIHLIQGQSHQAMQLADVVLLASGTSSLEAMLLKRPMVVAYRLSTMTYAIAKHLVKTPYISLPNLIADEALVDEFIQDEATVENLSLSVLKLLEPEMKQQLQKRFTELHESLRLNASEKAAEALLKLIKNKHYLS